MRCSSLKNSSTCQKTLKNWSITTTISASPKSSKPQAWSQTSLQSWPSPRCSPLASTSIPPPTSKTLKNRAWSLRCKAPTALYQSPAPLRSPAPSEGRFCWPRARPERRKASLCSKTPCTRNQTRIRLQRRWAQGIGNMTRMSISSNRYCKKRIEALLITKLFLRFKPSIFISCQRFKNCMSFRSRIRVSSSSLEILRETGQMRNSWARSQNFQTPSEFRPLGPKKWKEWTITQLYLRI